jgi:hypothetical protein
LRTEVARLHAAHTAVHIRHGVRGAAAAADPT